MKNSAQSSNRDASYLMATTVQVPIWVIPEKMIKILRRIRVMIFQVSIKILMPNSKDFVKLFAQRDGKIAVAENHNAFGSIVPDRPGEAVAIRRGDLHKRLDSPS